MTVVWDNIPTTVTVTGQTGTVVYAQGTTQIDTGTIGIPTGAAGGDLTGTYPNPTVHRIHGQDVQAGTPNDLDMWQYHAANNRWRHRTWTQTMTDNGVTAAGLAILDDADAAAQRTTLGAAAASHTHAASDVSAAGSSGQVMFNNGGAFAGDAGLTYDASTDSLTVGTTSGGSLIFGDNGEYIKNTVDGRIDFMPAPHPSDDFGIYFDLTSSAFYAKIGTINSAGNLNTNAGIQFDNSLAIAASKAMDFGNTGGLIAYYAQTTANGTWYFAPYIGTGNAGSVCLVSQNAQGVTNRRPSTAHTNPTLYVYAAGSANANDFVRINHDTTDGYVESGRGTLRLLGASGVRIDSTAYGIGVAPTAVQTGYTTFTNLTTDRTCNANATTVEELADILGTLIEDLKAKGIISA